MDYKYSATICGYILPAQNVYYYPDLIGLAGQPVLMDKHFDCLANPSFIIEVLSSSTKSRDRGPKFEAYRSIPSFQEYLLVSQSQAKIEGFYKNDQGEWIIREPVRGIDAEFSFQKFDLSLSLKRVYGKVDFSKADPEEDLLEDK